MSSFKENLRNELLFKDIQLKEFAAKIRIPYTTLLSYVDKKECLPKIDVAYKMAQELDVTLEFLITGNPKDNYKKNLSPTYKELLTLPSNVISSIKEIIHAFYELYNQTKDGKFYENFPISP